MKQEFWDVCRKNKIVVGISRYPIKVKYDLLENLAKQNSVEFEVFAYRDDFWKWTILDKRLPRLSGWSNFFYCPLANKCHTYRNGRLYTCCIAAHIHHFEKKYGLFGLHDVESNAISASADTKKIGRFLSGPIPMCRYCFIKKDLQVQEWKHGMGDMNEWK